MKRTMDHGKLMMAVAVGILTAGVSVRASEMDDRIESADRKTYVFQIYLKGDSIKIESAAGVVTLGGKAKNAAERDLATKLISDVHGVKSVVNTMAI